MNIAVFDSCNGFIDHINSKAKEWNFDLVIDSFIENTDLKVGNVFSTEKDKYDTVIINLDAQLYNSQIIEYKTIEIIFWLRIKLNYSKPIIVCSFLPLDRLLQIKPTATILLAPGVYFQDTLSDFAVLKQVSNKLIKETDNFKRELIPFVKNYFDLTSFRHIEANWFGIKRLWDLQTLITKPQTIEPYPDEIKSKMESLSYLLADYLYPLNDNEIGVENYMNRIFEEIDNQLKILKEKSKKFDSYSKDDLNWFLKEFNNEKVKAESEIEQLLIFKQDNYLEYIKEIKEKIGVYKSDMENLNNVINTFNKKDKKITGEIVVEPNYPEIPSIEKSKLKKSRIKPKILLIDDQSQSGWQKVYKRVLQADIDIISFGNINNVGELIESILNKLEGENYKIIFLDLMLFPDDNAKSKSNISGLKVLDWLYKNYPYIPILITSASNKIWNFKEVIKRGAFGYWMKEGIDNFYNFNSSFENFYELQRIYYKFSSEEYDTLFSMGKFATNLNKPSFNGWWAKNSFEWGIDKVQKNSFERTITKKISANSITSVKKLFNDAVNLYRSLLIDDLNRSSYWEIHNTIVFEGIITQLSKAIEAIHDYRLNDNNFTYYNGVTMNDVMSMRGDKEAIKLSKVRNNTVHYNFGKEIMIKMLNDYVDQVMAYLSKENFTAVDELANEAQIRDDKQVNAIVENVKRKEKNVIKFVQTKPEKPDIIKVYKPDTVDKTTIVSSEKMESSKIQTSINQTEAEYVFTVEEDKITQINPEYNEGVSFEHTILLDDRSEPSIEENVTDETKTPINLFSKIISWIKDLLEFKH